MARVATSTGLRGGLRAFGPQGEGTEAVLVGGRRLVGPKVPVRA
jgi:hypothetical protein